MIRFLGKSFFVLLPLALIMGGFFLIMRSEPKEIELLGSGVEPQATSSMALKQIPKNLNGDIEFQNQLANPSKEIRAVYATGWSAGSASAVDRLIKLIDETELNAIVIDIKDYSGFLSYEIDNLIARDSGALKEIRIVKPNTLIKKLHDKGIYVIARISVFQDSILSKAHPEWALANNLTNEPWTDKKGIRWMDAASKPVWDYTINIAKDALARGFDEVNFDYIRFPSDGKLDQIKYPSWDGIREKNLVLKDFFAYLRKNLGEAKLSADLFGLVTIDETDLGIGQIVEDAFPYFDYIAPMIYPSHYASGIFGYKNPADHPYEVIRESLLSLNAKIKYFDTGFLAQNATGTRLAGSTSTLVASISNTIPKQNLKRRAKIRPWLQDFDLGATYTGEMVRAQITASEELGNSGWMLWDPKNIYTRSALLPG